MNKLNLGCGLDVKEGYVNLDVVLLPGVDVVHNIEKLPLPFHDEEFEEILCRDVLEHIDYPPLLKELHRILKPGGVLKIRVPHFTSNNNFIDPTHRKLFSIATFDFFTKNNKHYHQKAFYQFDFSFSHVGSCHITFRDAKTSKLFMLNSWVGKIINKNKRRQLLYEETALARLFPARNIIIELVK